MMKKLFMIAALMLLMSATMYAQTKKVGLLIGSEEVSAIESADERAAAEWFQSTYPEGVIVTPETLSEIANLSTLWVAIDRIGIPAGWTNLPEGFRTNDVINALAKHVKAGGSLLLTNHATQLTVPIGRIDAAYAPNIFGSGEGGDNSDTWGVHPVIGNAEAGEVYDHVNHPIYDGMTYYADLFAGIYCFESAGIKGDHNCMWDLNAYGLVPNPNTVKAWEDATNSTVLGTWNHVVDYCCAGIVDFNPTTTIAGRILAVGLASYEWDLAGGINEYADQLQLFTQNSLNYLLDNTEKDFNYVDPDDPIDVPTDDEATEPMAAVEGTVGLLIGFDNVSNIFDDDELAAAEWFEKSFADGIIITPSTLDDMAKVNTLWVPIDREGIEIGAFNLPEPFCDGDVAQAIANHVKEGGSLLLTNHATQLVSAIGRIDEKFAPNIFGAGTGGDNGDVWGVNAQIGITQDEPYDHSSHDIFTGLAKNNTMYADHSFFPLQGAGWKEDHNCKWDFNAEAYGLEDTPNKLANFEQKTTSVVLGAWQHVTDYACAGLIEFLPVGDFKGTVIANGLAAYEWSQNSGENAYQVNMEYLTWNCLNYLNGKSVKTIDATGIHTFEHHAVSQHQQIYDLQGRAVKQSAAVKGLYIQGNKKFAIK